MTKTFKNDPRRILRLRFPLRRNLDLQSFPMPKPPIDITAQLSRSQAKENLINASMCPEMSMDRLPNYMDLPLRLFEL